MGGRYWYFVSGKRGRFCQSSAHTSALQYRIDGDVDYYNPTEPSTTSCPFLPGQTLNILEVPVQGALTGPSRRGSSASFGSAVYTMDPKDKYRKPKPIAPGAVNTPSPGGRKGFKVGLIKRKTDPAAKSSGVVSDPAIDKPNGNVKSKKAPAKRPQTSYSPIKRSIWSTFFKIRNARTEGPNTRQAPGVGHANGMMENVSPVGAPTWVCNPKSKSAIDLSRSEFMTNANTVRPKLATPPASTCASQSTDTGSKIPKPFQSDLKPEISSSGPKVLPKEGPADPYVSYYFAPFKQLQTHNSFFKGKIGTHPQMSLAAGGPKFSASPGTPHQWKSENNLPVIESTKVFDLTLDKEARDQSLLQYDNMSHRTTSHVDSGSPSYRTQDNFSPGLASSSNRTETTPPYRPSPSESPPTSDFGGDFLHPARRPVLSHVRSACDLKSRFHLFSGASEDHCSALTPRGLPNPAYNPSGATPGFDRHVSGDLVHSWNDGSEHRITALEELVDDLGYLGQLIS